MMRRPWSEEDNRILRELYVRPETTAKEIGAILGRGVSSVHCQAAKLGLKKPIEYKSIAGHRGAQCAEAIAHRFPKGTIPPNKGKKLTPEQYAKMAPTMFKKGQHSHNHREIGSERVNVDGYIEIKVAEPNKWALKHRIVWEQANGPIPRGYNVQFKNGNSQDVRLENLYLISQADQLKYENSFYVKYPKELQDVIRLKGAIKRQITITKRKAK